MLLRPKPTQDPVKKAEGIKRIDEFIHRSDNMFILYNNDYLERLWCW